MRVALIGNPNCGKTTLFNALTGMRRKVGNFPGVTVSPQSAPCRFDRSIELIDLPGIYSLDAPGNEEACVCSLLDGGGFDAVLMIIDATLIKRAMTLFCELAKRKVRLSAVFTMNDAAEACGDGINEAEAAKRLCVPTAKFYPGDRDSYMAVCKTMRAAVLPRSVRARLLRQNPAGGMRDSATERLDRLLCGSFTGPIIASATLALVFAAVFMLGGRLCAPLEAFFELLGCAAADMLSRLGVSEAVSALVLDGALGGVFAVLSFLPGLMVLYIMTAILEDSGYLARIAYLCDPLMRRFGLSGKAAVSLLLGFGCSVPALMATGTLDSRGERGLCAFLIPFMTCSAKLPVLMMLVGSLFKGNSARIAVCFMLCVFGVITAMLMSAAYKCASKRVSGKASLPALFIELPKYRMPRARSVLLSASHKVIDYVSRAGSVVFIASFALSLLMKLCEGKSSRTNGVVGLLEKIFSPVGFGRWELLFALLTGLCAKETLAAALKVSSASYGGIAPMLEGLGIGAGGVYSYLIFIMLYPPCIAAEAAMAEKLGTRRALFDFLFRLALAYAASLVFFTFNRLLTR